MARLIGTGKDPLGRYGKGEVFDVPEDDPLHADLIDKGWAKEVKPEDDPAKSDAAVANAVVSQGGSHQLQDPVEQAKAEKIGARAQDIVHTGDPNAKLGAAGLDPEPDEEGEDQESVPPSARRQEESEEDKSAKGGSKK